MDEVSHIQDLSGQEKCVDLMELKSEVKIKSYF